MKTAMIAIVLLISGITGCGSTRSVVNVKVDLPVNIPQFEGGAVSVNATILQ